MTSLSSCNEYLTFIPIEPSWIISSTILYSSYVLLAVTFRIQSPLAPSAPVTFIIPAMSNQINGHLISSNFCILVSVNICNYWKYVYDICFPCYIEKTVQKRRKRSELPLI
ncbi:hypothetical protein D3C79_803000 [compost metagenome]